MKYIVSKFLISLDPTGGIIQNTLSGERFEATDEVLKLLSYFKEPHTINEALGYVRIKPREVAQLRSFLTSLRRSKFLVPYPEIDASRGPSILALTNKALVQGTRKTFLSCPSVGLKSIQKDQIVFLGVPFDLGTTGFPGARFAPERMRELSSDTFEYHTDIFTGAARGWFSIEHNRHVFEGRKFVDVGNVILQVGEGFDQLFDRLGKIVDQILRKGGFPVIIGGDHSCSYALIRSFKKRYGRIGVIHIDAHTDLADLLPGIPNNHGNVFTRILEENLVDHLYQYGIRGMIGKKRIDKNYSLFPMQQLTTDNDLRQAVAQLDTGVNYYLSLDIDVLDPSYAPGTGTAIPFGMRTETLYKLLSLITARVTILGFDLVEVNPMMDNRDQTCALANSIIILLLAEIEKREQG